MLLVRIFTIGFRSFFFEFPSIDDIISFTSTSSATLPPAASAASAISSSTFNSSGRLCLSHSASRLSLTSRRSSLTLSTSSSRINCSSLCRPSSVCLLASVPDANASQHLQLSDKTELFKNAFGDFELAKLELLKPSSHLLRP